jgi:hypothetical protein
VLAALVLALLVLVAGVSGELGAAGVAALAAVSVLWLLVDAPMEGPILITVTPTHGVTGADLAGVVGLALAAYRAVPLHRRSRSREHG